MNKTTLSIVIAVVVVVIIIGAIYFLQQSNTSPNNNPTQQSQTQNNQPVTPTNTATSTSPATVNITIQNFAFSPSDLSIKVGDTVTWTNQDSTQHTITGGDIQSDPLNKGQTYSFTFNTAGTFNYHCSIHPSMTGKITVQ